MEDDGRAKPTFETNAKGFEKRPEDITEQHVLDLKANAIY